MEGVKGKKKPGNLEDGGWLSGGNGLFCREFNQIMVHIVEPYGGIYEVHHTA
ncbi:MAG: hypothetical protein K9M96_18795 [Deltaproteobacteria bacterium]|nr:hypothetical protein [Deltaproteobacteria bacterium]